MLLRNEHRERGQTGLSQDSDQGHATLTDRVATGIAKISEIVNRFQWIHTRHIKSQNTNQKICLTSKFHYTLQAQARDDESYGMYREGILTAVSY